MNRPGPRLWATGDWNALFGFGTNILVNLLTLTSLLRFALHFPDQLVFGRILPATGLMLFLSTAYYAWLALRLARATGRDDVCALPSGVSVGHMFIVVFVIMMPILRRTNDPEKAWEAGLAWVAIQSVVLVLGGVVAPWVRRVTPRAALLGPLAGVALTYIAMGPMLQTFLTPVIGLGCLGIVLLAWLGGVRYWRGTPAGIVAIAFGLAVAWGAQLFGHSYGGVTVAAVAGAVANFGLHAPRFAGAHLAAGFQFAGTLLVTAIPFGVYDLVEAIDNVESAAAGGDNFPALRVLAADGVVSLVGACFGNPFINAVYIGHAGWKGLGGRIGYSFGTGLVVLVLCWTGLLGTVLAILPAAAVLPILVFIGMIMGAQAFQECPPRHAPAIALALIPTIAGWALNLVDNALGAAGIDGGVGPALQARMEDQGVLYGGLRSLAAGSVLTAMMFAAMTALLIDRAYRRAAAFAAFAALLTYFGFIHGERIAVGQHLALASSYLLLAGIFLAADSFCRKS